MSVSCCFHPQSHVAPWPQNLGLPCSQRTHWALKFPYPEAASSEHKCSSSFWSASIVVGTSTFRLICRGRLVGRRSIPSHGPWQGSNVVIANRWQRLEMALQDENTSVLLLFHTIRRRIGLCEKDATKFSLTTLLLCLTRGHARCSHSLFFNHALLCNQVHPSYQRWLRQLD